MLVRSDTGERQDELLKIPDDSSSCTKSYRHIVVGRQLWLSDYAAS
jgi:hypothetical protein